MAIGLLLSTNQVRSTLRDKSPCLALISRSLSKKFLLVKSTLLIRMSTTFAQLINRARKPKRHRSRVKALEQCPQKRGICLKVYTTTPKKPNSGLRKVAKVRLSNGRKIIAQIPGIGHNLHEHSAVLVRAGRVRDIPGVNYRILRGLLDCKPVANRKTSRSKYGIKRVSY